MVETTEVRPCPGCGERAIDTAELAGGTHCRACGGAVEISVLYSVALSLVLLLLLKFFIVRGDLVIAVGVLALMVVRWLHLDWFDARYLPLVTAHHR